MPTYQVAPSQVAGVIDEMAAAQQSILTMIQNLQQQTTANLAEWSSEAQQQYQIVKARWDEAGNEMPILLQAMRGTLDGIINDYAQAETRGRQLFNG